MVTPAHPDQAADAAAEMTAAFRAAMGNYPTGVAIVTTKTADGEPVGLTINSLASVSMDPLLLLWSVANSVNSAGAFIEGGLFAVHLLGAHQSDTAMTFATKGHERFTKHRWGWSERGLPILQDSAAVFECALYRAVEAGDHTILIGEVLQVAQADRAALLYHRRGFHSVAPLPVCAEPLTVTQGW